MNDLLRVLRYMGVSLCLALAACGGGGGEADSAGGGAPAAGTVVGAAGGTVAGPNGASLVIPPGALAANTTIRIEQTSAGAPALPGGFVVSGPMFAFTPHGTTFAAPVTMTLPFDPTLVPAGVTPELLKTNAANEWQPVPGAVFGANSVTAQLSSFSLLQPVQTIEREDPNRRWFFSHGPDPDFPIVEEGPRNAQGELVDLGGEIHEIRNFGSNPIFNVFDGDDTTTLEVFSSANGVTFWASAEDVGLAQLRQSQKFEALTDRPTLRFVVTAGLLEAMDFNNAVLPSECPRGPDVAVCAPMNAHIRYEAQALTLLGELLRKADGEPVLDTAGYARLAGRQAGWQDLSIERLGTHTTMAWQRSDFLFLKDVEGTGAENHARAKLTRNLVFNLDLSSLRKGAEFRVTSLLFAYADNRRRRESALGAFVRDPAKSDGIAVEFTGLRLVGETQEPPAPLPRPAATCTTGPDPAAGVLQFSTPAYSLVEAQFAGLSSQGVMVTRSQGSKGAVSVNVTASGGTATAGVHYKPLVTTVHFADGDTERRLVEVELLQNAGIEADKTVNLVLSAPGGCASLGAVSNAVLTILDDDQPQPLPPPSGLDTSFGNAGKATLEGFGGDRSAMALQADGKIVMVGGTFVDFVLARFNADGSLDTGFGIDGKVTTDMGSGLRGEEALAVAIQADGKMVVVGYTAIPNTPPAPALPPTFAIARYNGDGSLDTSFGMGGRVSGNVNGLARAVAIQPDGKIVLAGDVSFPSTNNLNFSDFTVARFNANGSLDLAFGTSGTGQVATDIGGASNTGSNLVLQPNGAIVVSGHTAASSVEPDHTDIVRYNANGTLDPSFGSGGKLTLAGVLAGEGLVRQGDGRFVLAGNVTVATVPATARFLLMRLNVDGSPDAGFGNAGRVDTAFTDNAGARAVALQGDGKIVAVGTRAFSPNPNFIVARYNADGSLDTGFGGGDGNLSIDFFGFDDIGENVLVQLDGKIVVGGQARNNVDGYGVARINP